MPYEYEYPRPAVSADLVVVDRKSGTPKLLLIQRLRDPFANCWALPGGFMEIDETLEQAAIRELEEETGIVTEEVTLLVLSLQLIVIREDELSRLPFLLS